jgi:hypothetical protein
LDSFDSALELLDFFGDALEFILVAFDVRARFNAFGYHVQHFGIESVDSALFECGDSNESGAGNSKKGDGKTVLGDSNL